MAERPPARVRQLVAGRANGRCEYCLSPEEFATQSFVVEHIWPTSRGGKTVPRHLGWGVPGRIGWHLAWPGTWPGRLAESSWPNRLAPGLGCEKRLQQLSLEAGELRLRGCHLHAIPG